MKLFLDMDGVIADFFGKLEERFNVDHWKDIDDPSKAISTLKTTNWFYTLNTFSTSVKLVSACRRIAGRNYGICSSPIIGDEHNSGYWKREWLKHNGFLPEIRNLIFTNTKPDYAIDNISGKPNILVDDSPDNVSCWIKSGGIGICYQANKDSLEDLIGVLETTHNSSL